MAAGLLLLWTAIHLLAALPCLHHALHEEAPSAQHECLLTEFLSGVCDSPPPHPVVDRVDLIALRTAADPSLTGTSKPLELPLAPRPPPAAVPPFSDAGS